jgi:oligoribonuclease
MAEAQQSVLDFVKKHIPKARTAPLAGNSVHVDRVFLAKDMPELEAHLHYRNVGKHFNF